MCLWGWKLVYSQALLLYSARGLGARELLFIPFEKSAARAMGGLCCGSGSRLLAEGELENLVCGDSAESQFRLWSWC